MSDKTITRRPRLVGPRKTLAIVASTFNEDYVQGLIDACRNEIVALMPQASIPLYRVPGAYEIPTCAEYVLNHTNADIVIALGVVMEGETAHADIIARTVAQTLSEMSVRHELPVINQVLLLKDEQQAHERCFGAELNRGTEAARAALSMVELFHKLHAAYPSKKAAEKRERTST